MGFFRAAGRAYGKVNSAVIKATSPRKWRKSVDNYQQGHHDFSKSANVANLRVSRGKESYDLLIDNDEIHVAYQDKQGKTQWRKAADVGDFTAIDPGKPPSPQGLNRHWANTYKTSGGTYKGFDAKVKYLQDYGYQVAALDKRPYKAWRSGDKKTAESYVQQVESGQRLQGTPEFFGDYIDPKQAHSTADQQYRRRFFQDVSGQSWQQQKGRVWTGSAWRRPPNPPQEPPAPPPTAGPTGPTSKGPRKPKSPTGGGFKPGPQSSGGLTTPNTGNLFGGVPRVTVRKENPPPSPERNMLEQEIQAKQLEAPAQASKSREWRYVQEKQAIPPQPVRYSEQKAENKPVGQIEDDRAGVEARKFADKIADDFGRGKPGVLAEPHVIEIAQNARVPNFDDLDFNPDEAPKHRVTQTNKEIELSKFANKGTNLAAAGEPGQAGVNDITRWTGALVSGEAKGTKEGDIRIEGNEKIAAILKQIAEDANDPALKKLAARQAQQKTVEAESLRRQKELKAQGNNTEAEKIADATEEQLDPTGIGDALRIYNPETGQVERQQFLEKAKTNATAEEIAAWNQQSGQFAKNLKDTEGFRELYIPQSRPDISARPGQNLNKLTEHVPAAADSGPDINLNQFSPTGNLTKAQKEFYEAEQRRSGKFSDVQVAREDQMQEFEVTDEQKIDKILAQYGAAANKRESIQKLNALFTGKPLEEINQGSAQNQDVERYADAIAPLLGRLRSMNESRYLTSSDINPASPGTINQYETTDAQGRKVVKSEAGAPYTDKTAETRLHNAENYIFDTGKQVENQWRKYLTENAPPELLNLDPKLSRKDRRNAIKAIADKTLDDIYARHQQNYIRQQDIRQLQESGKKIPDELLQSIEDLGVENIFDTSMGREFGDKLKLPRDSQNINLRPDIANLAEAANTINPKTGQPYGMAYTLQNLLQNDPAINAIAERYAAYDQAKVQKQAGFAGALLEQDPDNPVYQNMASNSYNQLARQGNELPTSVVPWKKSLEMTPDQALEAANLAQIEAARQAALPSPEEPYVPPPESGPVPISNRLSRRNKQQNTPVSPTPEQIQEQVLENATPTETGKPLWQMSKEEYLQTPEGQAKWQAAAQSVTDDYNAQIAQYSKGRMTAEKRARIQNAKEVISLIENNQIDGFLWLQIQTRALGTGTPEGHREQVTAALAEGRPVPPNVLNDYPDLLANQIDTPTEMPFSLKEPEQPGIGAGRSTSSMFDQDTALDQAARAGRYNPLEGQTSVFDQQNSQYQEEFLRDVTSLMRDAIENNGVLPPENPLWQGFTPDQNAVRTEAAKRLQGLTSSKQFRAAIKQADDDWKRSKEQAALDYSSGLSPSSVDQPAQAQPETVKEISIPLYNPGSSGLKNAPKGGVLEYLSKNKIKAPSMLRDKGGEYDGAEILPQSLLAKIYKKNQSASAPDQVVMSLIDQGILPEGAGVNDMWEAARREHQEIPQLMEKNAQVDRFSKQVLNTKTTKGKTEVDLEHLMPGETIELGGKGHEEEFTFKGVLAPGMEDDLDLPRSVINELINEGKEGYVLEDGAKYGVQVIPADQNILKANARDDQEHFVSTSKEVGDEVLYKGEIHVVQVHDYDNGQVFLQPKKRGKKAWVVAPTRGLSRDEKNQLRDEQRREARLLAEKYHNPDVPF